MDANRRVVVEGINSRLTHRVVISVCLFTCIVAIGSSIYCTYILHLIRHVQTDWISHHCGLNNQGQDSTIKHSYEDGHLKNDVVVEYTESHDVPSRSKRETRHKKCKCPKTLAAHYVQALGPEYFRETFQTYDDNRTVFNTHVDGLIASDGDFLTADYPLKIFELAKGWKEKSSPFKPLGSDGKFVAKKSGSYLIYVQVVFFDNKHIQELKVVHQRKDDVLAEYTCVRGLVKSTLLPVRNTCSVTSLFSLKKNDYIRVQLLDTDLRLNLMTVNTFFGAILLR